MARVFRLLAQLLDVDTSGVSDGDALTYDSGTSLWVPGSGGGGDLTDAVILAPDSSARNLILPTDPGFVPLAVKAAVGQTAHLQEWQEENGVVRAYVGKEGALFTNADSGDGIMRLGFLPESSAYSGIWIGQAAPDTNNYSLLGTPGQIFFNAPGSGGLMHFRVNNADVLQVAASTQFLFGSDVVIAYDAGGYFGIRMFVPSGGAGVIPVVVRGAASQAVSLHEWQDSTTAVLSRVNKDGYIMTRKVAAPADGDLATSELAFWLDDTAAAAKLMLKAKDSGGAVRTGILSLSGVDVADALSDHLTDEDGAHAADAISVTDADGNYASTQVEGALLEIANARISDVADFEDHSARHENGGADEISIAGLDGTPTELTNHLNDTADAHAGTAITNTPAGNIAATTVQAAINELDSEKTTAAAALTAAQTEIADQKRVVEILVSDPGGSAITTGDGKAYFRVPTPLNGHNLVSVGASVSTVSSSGIPTVQLRRMRLTSATAQSAADMLSTKLTIDATEFDSSNATAAVIDTSNDDVQTGDQINIDIDVAGTGTKGLVVSMTFEAP